MGSPVVSRIEFIRSIRSKLSNLLRMYPGSVKKTLTKGSEQSDSETLIGSVGVQTITQIHAPSAYRWSQSGLKVKYDDGRPAAYLGAKFRSPRHYRYRVITVSRP